MKQYYRLLVSEEFNRRVIIKAESWPEAVQIAEELCNDGFIDLTSTDFEHREISELEVVPKKYAKELGYYDNRGVSNGLAKQCNCYMYMQGAIYISGPITGVPDYMDKFEQAERVLRERYPGRLIINPAKMNATLPTDTSYAAYMYVALSLMKNCGMVYFMRGWENSNGARCEHYLAKQQNMVKIYEDN